MPRRREVPKREILPDPKYGNVELSKFMNVIMEGGKKAVAERIIYGALEHMEKKSGKDPLELFSTFFFCSRFINIDKSKYHGQ